MALALTSWDLWKPSSTLTGMFRAYCLVPGVRLLQARMRCSALPLLSKQDLTSAAWRALLQMMWCACMAVAQTLGRHCCPREGSSSPEHARKKSPSYCLPPPCCCRWRSCSHASCHMKWHLVPLPAPWAPCLLAQRVECCQVTKCSACCSHVGLARVEEHRWGQPAFSYLILQCSWLEPVF